LRSSGSVGVAAAQFRSAGEISRGQDPFNLSEAFDDVSGKTILAAARGTCRRITNMANIVNAGLVVLGHAY
jgi:hypothetical protein